MKHRKRAPNSFYARTLPEVRDEWNRISGQKLSRARVWQICTRAEKKLLEALKGAM